MHLSRFPDFNNLQSFIKGLDEARTQAMNVQRPLGTPTLAPEDYLDQVPFAERKMRAGVYRIVLTSPGYHDVSKTIELTENGQILTASGPDRIEPLGFPIGLELKPKVDTRKYRLEGMDVAVQPGIVTVSEGLEPPLAAC